MKLKRYIAFVLCTLYIAATAGMALASLTCKCLAMRSGAVEHLCLACRCEMAGGLPAADCGSKGWWRSLAGVPRHSGRDAGRPGILRLPFRRA